MRLLYTYYEELSDKSSLVQTVGEVVVEALLVEAISIEANECDERFGRGKKNMCQFVYSRL